MTPPASAGAVLRLLRISLAPTAAADAVAGMTLSASGWPGGGISPFLVIVTSLFLLHGGLVLNDWADREKDRRVRSSRPLPSGLLGSSTALALGLALLALGLLAAGAAHRELLPHAALLVIAILCYDLGPRGPWLGPLLLGTCRGLNLSLAIRAGMVLGGACPPWQVHLVPALYGLHVFFLSRLGRLEDGEDSRPAGRRPQQLLAAAAAVLVLVAVLPGVAARGAANAAPIRLADMAAPAVALCGVMHLRRAARSGPFWSQASLQRAMGMALGGLALFAGVVALRALPSSAGPEVLCLSVLVLAGLPLSRVLARTYPPS